MFSMREILVFAVGMVLATVLTAMAVVIGLVGYGLAGRVFHAPLITATPGLELVSVVTSVRSSRSTRPRISFIRSSI